MTITNTGRQAALASMAFSERTATLRDCTWTQLTSSSYLQTSVLNNATASASQLGSLTETITVNSYPTALNPAISVVRNSNGTVTVATTNSAIASGSMARVDISLNWTGSNGRSRTEGTTTVIARVDP